MNKRITEEELQQLQNEGTKENAGKNKEKKSVTVYIIILFAAVLILILISYFIQQRNNQNTIRNLTNSHNEFSTQAMQNIEELQDKNLEYAVQVQQLEDENTQLQEDVENGLAENEHLQEVNEALTENNKEWKLRYDTMCAFYDLKKAVEEDDMETAVSKQHVIEAAKEYFDQSYMEEFNELVEQIQK